MSSLNFDCNENLFIFSSFISILTLLLSADKTYAKLAKDLVTVDSKGPVLTLMGNMIQTQLLNYSRFGLPSPMLLVNLWLQCLTRVPQWNKDSGVVHILDVMTRVAYQFQDCYYTVREHFRPFFSIAEIKVPKSTGILNFISGSNMLDILTAPSSDAVWLSLLLLEMEFDLLESQNSIWPELLVQLIQNDKSSLSSALKVIIQKYFHYDISQMFLISESDFLAASGCFST